MQNKHDMKKPLKAIEPVSGNDLDKIMGFFEKVVNAPTDAVENKEERVDHPLTAPKKSATNPTELKDNFIEAWGKVGDEAKLLRTAIEVGIRFQELEQSQSIEGIVGFVLEKAKDRIMSYLDSANTDEEKGFQSGIGCALSVFKGLDDDIINEYNNGK